MLYSTRFLSKSRLVLTFYSITRAFNWPVTSLNPFSRSHKNERFIRIELSSGNRLRSLTSYGCTCLPFMRRVIGGHVLLPPRCAAKKTAVGGGNESYLLSRRGRLRKVGIIAMRSRRNEPLLAGCWMETHPWEIYRWTSSFLWPSISLTRPLNSVSPFSKLFLSPCPFEY